ncbi:MAG: flagellin [Rhodospirillaceae bacterium]|nr:flagellin [Rhodospirillales bacterium]
MGNEITLGAGMRTNLLSLQKTASLVGKTNSRLSTGNKVNSAIDDAVAYFQAKSLTDRASDLGGRKDGIDQGISSLTTALAGMESVEKVMVQMKGVVLSAKSATASERASLGAQLTTLAYQMNYLANDASYQGLNLVNATVANLKVQFSDKTNAVLQVDGADVRISSGVVMTAFTGNASFIALEITKIAGFSGSVGAATIAGFSDVSNAVSLFDAMIEMFDSGISSVRTTSKALGVNVALLQARSDFSKEYINTLTVGAGKLTLADLNEEGANLVSLQTRQQLGIQALSFAGQSEQGVLSLLR